MLIPRFELQVQLRFDLEYLLLGLVGRGLSLVRGRSHIEESKMFIRLDQGA